LIIGYTDWSILVFAQVAIFSRKRKTPKGRSSSAVVAKAINVNSADTHDAVEALLTLACGPNTAGVNNGRDGIPTDPNVDFTDLPGETDIHDNEHAHDCSILLQRSVGTCDC
jgi:hypothetical protein